MLHLDILFIDQDFSNLLLFLSLLIKFYTSFFLPLKKVVEVLIFLLVTNDALEKEKIKEIQINFFQFVTVREISRRKRMKTAVFEEWESMLILEFYLSKYFGRYLDLWPKCCFVHWSNSFYSTYFKDHYIHTTNKHILLHCFEAYFIAVYF